MLLQNRFVLVNLAANVAFVLCDSGIVRFQFLLDQCGWVVVIQTIVLLQTVLISEYNFSFFLFFFFFSLCCWMEILEALVSFSLKRITSKYFIIEYAMKQM